MEMGGGECSISPECSRSPSPLCVKSRQPVYCVTDEQISASEPPAKNAACVCWTCVCWTQWQYCC